MKKTLIEIVSALALTVGGETALAQFFVPPSPVYVQPYVQPIQPYVPPPVPSPSPPLPTDYPSTRGSLEYDHPKVKLIDENTESRKQLKLIENAAEKYLEYCSDHPGKCKNSHKRTEKKDLFLSGKPATASSDSSDAKKELGSGIRIDSTSTAVTSPASLSTNKDPCPEDLSLEQLQSYTLIESRPPLERYLNKEGCVGTISYNSSEKRITYYTASKSLTDTIFRITDTVGKTTFNGNLAGAVEATGIPAIPLSGYIAETQSGFSCAGQYITATQTAIGAGAGFLLISTPLGLYVLARRRERVAETVYTTTRMGV